MKKLFIYLLALLGLHTFIACEEVVDIDIDAGTSQLTVDGWVTNRMETQKVKLTLSQGYFAETFNPPALNATVTVTDDLGDTYTFTDDDNDGVYIWEPTNEPLGRIGGTYGLSITYNGETFVSSTEIRRVPEIDSLVYRYEESNAFGPEGYYAEFYARDFVGTGDCYWIKTFKNGEYLNKPFELNAAYDASFSPGASTDGIPFITPIREGINPIPDPDVDPTPPPYEVGDSIYVELHSITEGVFFYLIELQAQLQNGGLFAVPTTNLPTNIFNTNPNSSVSAVGFFGGSAVNSAGVRVKE